MGQINVNIRMDEDLKKEFEKFCSNVGMTMTTAMCVFAKRTVLERRIPFDISDIVPNEATRKAIETSENNIDTEGSFNSVSDLMKALNA